MIAFKGVGYPLMSDNELEGHTRQLCQLNYNFMTNDEKECETKTPYKWSAIDLCSRPSGREKSKPLRWWSHMLSLIGSVWSWTNNIYYGSWGYKTNKVNVPHVDLTSTSPIHKPTNRMTFQLNKGLKNLKWISYSLSKTRYILKEKICFIQISAIDRKN